MLKIIFFGTPNFVIPVLEALRLNFDLVGTVTSPDATRGRKRLLTPSPVSNVVSTLGIPILKPEKFTPDVAQCLCDLQPDLFVVAAYRKIIPENILQIAKFGAINIHPSLLPKYRGPSPIQAAVLNGDETSGISIIKMDKEMDHGPVIFAKEFILSDQDNFETLSRKMFYESAQILPQIINNFVEGKIIFQEQDHSQATFTKIIHKEDGYFDINTPLSPEKLDRMVRAYFPWPTAWTKWSPSQPQKTRSLRSETSGSKTCEAKIVKFLPGGLIQMEGKKAVPLKDFLNGYPDFPIKDCPTNLKYIKSIMFLLD